MAAASLSLPGVTNSPGWVRYIVQQHDNGYAAVTGNRGRRHTRARLPTRCLPPVIATPAFNWGGYTPGEESTRSDLRRRRLIIAVTSRRKGACR